ncbi:MAG: guanylate kinase, partial [Pseudomonadota bacterium]
GVLLVVSAPSGAGKTSLVRALVGNRPGITVSVSHTTRERRPKEIDGKDYHFVDAAVFRQLIDEGEMLEYAQVFDHFYGTSRAAVLEQLAQGTDVVLEIDWQGARQIRERFADCVSLEILPPSLATLERRLRGRGQDSEAIIERRMRDAVEEISHFQEFDYLIVNDDFDTALAELNAIVTAERARLPVQRVRQRARLKDLLGDHPSAASI